MTQMPVAGVFLRKKAWIIETAGAETICFYSTSPVLMPIARTRESIEAPMKINPLAVIAGAPMVTEPGHPAHHLAGPSILRGVPLASR
jgi:hypothetical protein